MSVHCTDQHGDKDGEEGEHYEEEHKKSSSKKVIQAMLYSEIF